MILKLLGAKQVENVIKYKKRYLWEGGKTAVLTAGEKSPLINESGEIKSEHVDSYLLKKRIKNKGSTIENMNEIFCFFKTQFF